MNRALARLVERFRFKGAPYPRSLDLIAELRKEATTPEHQALITDLFEAITIYDLKATDAVTQQLPDLTYRTRITIEAGKFTADGKGNERPATLAENIEVGVFTDRPGAGAFDKADVLSIKRMPVRSGKQVVEIISKGRPTYAGIDPYNFYIDRDADDNLVPVS